MLIRGKHAIRQPVILVEHRQLAGKCLAVLLRTRDQPPQWGCLQRLGIVHSVCLHGAVIVATRFHIQVGKRARLGIVKIGKLRPPVIPLLLQKACELQ